jgi:hypothetical protein
MPSHSAPKPRGIRRIERWVVGIAMAVVAFVLERIVMRSVRKRGSPDADPQATTMTSKGGEVDLEERPH